MSFTAEMLELSQAYREPPGQPGSLNHPPALFKTIHSCKEPSHHSGIHQPQKRTTYPDVVRWRASLQPWRCQSQGDQPSGIAKECTLFVALGENIKG